MSCSICAAVEHNKYYHIGRDHYGREMVTHAEEEMRVIDSVIASSGMIGTMTDCLTKAVIQTEGYGFPRGESEAPMFAGICAHTAFEHWLAGATPDVCIAKFEELYHNFSQVYLTADNRLYHDNLKEILSVFFSKAPLNSMPFTVEEAFIEKQFVIKLSNGIYHTVKPDGLVRDKDTGMLLAFELKTKKAWSDWDWDAYDTDDQIDSHILGMHQLGRDVKGVLILGITFNLLPRSRFSEKTGKEYACKEHPSYKVSQCRPDHVKWGKRTFLRTPEQLQMYRVEAVRAMVEYRDALEAVRTYGFNQAIKFIRAQGRLHGTCNGCNFNNFCIGSNRQRPELLIKSKPNDENVIHSGLISCEEANRLMEKENI